MNRHRHRIIFNKRRGQLMVVAETAQAGGKAASGERAGATLVAGSPVGVIWAMRQTLLATWLAVGALPMAWAQIIADPNAPANQRPTILSDNQGRPLVNIQTPSAAGLSRNTYRQFDVQSNGVVLNNSASNPWMANGVTARTILNEVNSTNRTFINGAITVNGAAAQVIVANPNGITVNGGSFVNATRATLATGTAQVSNGALTGFNIRGGGVTIGAGGMNNSATPYTDILSRAVSVVGALRAQNLGITTGLQTVAYDTGLITNQDTNTYAAGALTIDTASLGGMYANNISILATEAGLGVRNQGTWQATGGQIVVTADGLLQNLGTVRANVVSLATVKGPIENAGSIQGSQAVITSSGGDTRLFGAGLQQSAGSAVVISAKGAVNLFNNASYGAARVASTATGGQVSVSAGQNINLHSGTSIAAHQDVQLSSDAVVSANTASITSGTGQVVAIAAGGIGLANTTVTGQQVNLETGAAFKDTTASVVVSGGSVRGQTQTTLLATGSVQVTSAAGATPVSSGGNVHIQAQQATTVGAGTRITAGQHMSVMAGTSLNLQAASGSTASNGSRVALSAGGNMFVMGNTITATGSTLSAGQDLSIEANDGNANLQALSNAGGTSVDQINLSAGKDLNVSVFKGSLWATGLQASGQNINLLSNGTTSVANATVRSGSNTQAVASTLTAREDLTVGSINSTAGASSQVQVVASSLNAAGQARILSNGVAFLTAATNTVNGVNSPARSSITAGSVAIQGGSVQTDAADIRTNGNKSTAAKSGDITVTATSGSALFNAHTGIRSQFNSTGNIALHANGTLTHWHTQANAGGSLSSTSATGQIQSTGAHLVAKDVLSLASKGAQTHTSGFYSAGAASLFNETGHLALNSTRVQAVGTLTAGLASVSGQTSIESGGTLGVDAASVLVGTTDLSIIQGQGDITLNPDNAARGTLAWSQIGVGRHLTLATRNGNMTLTGSAGANGQGSTSRTLRGFGGDLNLIANNITLQGSVLQTPNGSLNLTATTGHIRVDGLQANKTEAGFVNTYWDWAQLQGRDVTLRAAGNIDLATVYANASNVLTVQSGGHLTTSGNYIRWQVDNRGRNGWYQDEHYVTRTQLEGANGVNLGALGGTLTLNATDLRSAQTVNLQALQDIRLEAAEEHKLHQASSTSSSRSMLGLKKQTQTTHWHNEYQTAAPVTIAARDITLKAGNNIQTYATQFNASRNLHLEAGDHIHYYAVRNQEIRDTNTHRRSSFAGIRYNSSRSTNTRSLTSALPTQLQSQQNILSNSGGNQLLQGTRVSYGGTAAFNAGVGERARADARIILEGIRTTTTEVRTRESNYVVWQKMLNQGSVSETLTLPSFSGPTQPSFSAPGGLSVQIPQGDFRSQIQTLAQQPGMGYLNDLTQRRDVNWQPVKLAFEQWDYRQEGLTELGAAFIGIAVAMATGGTGAGLLGTTGTVSTAAANAAFTSLAAQASITLINNKGDVGKTLKQLGKSDTVKNMLIAAGVAGVTSYTDNWGRTLLTDTGNTVVTDWAKRGQAYMLNTAAKGVLTGASSSSDWWTIAALGLSGEAYQYWVGRGADVRPGVDRDDPQFRFDEEHGFFRVPREKVDGVLREGKNIGHNQNPCLSVTRICHGMPFSNAMNALPGFNAFATLHDGWGEWLDKNGGNWNVGTNLGTMPPALLVNYGALLDQYRYINSRRK